MELPVVYLETAKPGFAWFRTYYRQYPELNRGKALLSLRRAEQVLSVFPDSGRRFQNLDEVREYPVAGTRFSLVYVVVRNVVWIIDIRDQRGLRSAEPLKLYADELRNRFGLD